MTAPEAIEVRIARIESDTAYVTTSPAHSSSALGRYACTSSC
jgi:hypothetical protein